MNRIEELRARRNELAQSIHTANTTLVTGPPCSGKTTYVHTHSTPGDVVIDYDALAVALGSPDTHRHPDHIRAVTTDVWAAAIAAAHRHAPNLWLIRTFPTATDRATANTVITLDVAATECKRRAHNAGRPEGWNHLIDTWWSQHEG